MEFIEEQLRQMLGMSVWSHKIHQKQAQIYDDNKNKLEFINIIVLMLAIVCIMLNIFIEEEFLNFIVLAFVIVSALISVYLKSCDFKGLHQNHRNSAVDLFSLKEDIISTLCDIKSNSVSKEELSKKRKDINARYLTICKKALDPKNKAFKKARKVLKIEFNNVYSDQEINSYLPNLLRKDEVEKIED